LGIDGTVINVGSKSLIVSMDPITGAIEKIGWLAVNINANDVATFGVKPVYFFSCLLLPKNASKRTLREICVQMDEAAKDLGIEIAGGHCEVTSRLQNPIVVGCAMGITEKGKYVTAGSAKQGDMLILTKSAGIEGTAILASDKEKQLSKALSRIELKKAKLFYRKISVVRDAITAFKTGGVNAMHDPTEGGVIGGIHEMADASNLGVQIYEEKIPVASETIKICKFFDIDPLQLIGSGALLIAANPKYAKIIVEKLVKKQINASIIGNMLSKSSSRLIVKKDGKCKDLQRPVSDHLWLALK
jgi:hydrogenase maturation factor